MPKQKAPKLNKDEFFMREALRLALKGRGRVHPNPMVGAVVVKNGRIAGRGAHEVFGGAHAEVNALKHVKNARGASLYVTLEPCAHFGKTPPCADLLISRKIKHVVAASKDIHPLVGGRGFGRLKKNGIRVKEGVLKKEAEALNRDYFFWARHKMPYVIVKAAQSVDGKIATFTGDSKWISSVASRKKAHALRASCDAVLVGVNTVLKDDPELTVRWPKKLPAQRQPVKIILDSSLKTPPSSKLFKSAAPGRVWLAAASRVSASKERRYRKIANVIRVKENKGRVDLKALLKSVAQKGIVSVLIEGGGEVIAEALKQRVVQELHCVIAPKIVGGRSAVSSVSGQGVASIEKAVKLKNMSVEFVGPDLWIKGNPSYV